MMFPIHVQRFSGALLALFLMASCDGSPKSLEPYTVSLKGKDMTKDIIFLEEKDIIRLYGKLEKFNPDRTPEEIRARCAKWEEPPIPDEASERWYRAAATIFNATLYQSSTTLADYHRMQMLYEGAARKGHFKAIRDLVVVYSNGTRGLEDWKYTIWTEPKKAWTWMNYGLTRKWPPALEWAAEEISKLVGYGEPEYGYFAYLQQAADLGAPLAQYEMSKYFSAKWEVEKQEAWLECAAVQNFGPALKDLGMSRHIDRRSKEALELYQRAIMAGGAAGGEAAYSLSSAFDSNVENRHKRDLYTTPDSVRENAYDELSKALNYGGETEGNIFYRFPRLNEVLPLPPATVKEWKGIYSAMSPEDAKYYKELEAWKKAAILEFPEAARKLQLPGNPELLIEEVRQAGLLVDEDYLSKPEKYDPNQ
jgi:hypothetical protein